MRLLLLIIAFALLSTAVAAPFLLMPSQNSMNAFGGAFSRGFRSFPNRGANMIDDSLMCPEYLSIYNYGQGNDAVFFQRNGNRIRQNRLDFKLSCLAQARGKTTTEALMGKGTEAMDAY